MVQAANNIVTDKTLWKTTNNHSRSAQHMTHRHFALHRSPSTEKWICRNINKCPMRSSHICPQRYNEMISWCQRFEIFLTEHFIVHTEGWSVNYEYEWAITFKYHRFTHTYGNCICICYRFIIADFHFRCDIWNIHWCRLTGTTKICLVIKYK